MPEGKRVAPTRDRILDEAFGLFADRGFHAVSVRDIAAAAGIKDASLYNHFPGKQALFDAIIARELDRLRAMFQPKGVLFDVGDDPREYDPSDPRALERQVHESVRPFFEDASLRQLRRLLVISQFESEDAAQAYRLVFIERPLALQRSAFEHGMATGTLLRDDAARMALEFQGPVFLMLHAGMTWDEAKPKVSALLASFLRRYGAAGKAPAGAAAPSGSSEAADERGRS
ncbi:TetR/AcrR family transcriptional regulator [Paraeggerthella sp.]|uniref:TetR/AcrR family transcriptional regulator n=1 Tax=Paraeggerthella TaxID=651554 RepID=UPI003AB53CEA